MTFYIFDQEFNRRGILTNYISAEWTEDYYSNGNFYLVCHDTALNISLLKRGWYVLCPDKASGNKYLTAMVIRSVKFISADRQIIVRGHTTNDLLRQRVLDRTHSVANVEQGMRNLISTILKGKRDIPRYVLSDSNGFTDVFETQFTGTNLLEALTVLGEASGIGFYTEFDYKNKQHVFTPYKGVVRIASQRENRRQIFSDDLLNLKNMTVLSDDTNYKSMTYVAGSGEGDERVWVAVNDDETEGLDRFELFTDARDLQQTIFEDGNEITYTDEEYYQILTARGLQKLKDYPLTESFVGEIDPKDFGTYYYLGDVVSSKSDRYGIRIDTRILSFTQRHDGGLTTLSLSMGEPEVTVLEVMKSLLS